MPYFQRKKLLPKYCLSKFMQFFREDKYFPTEVNIFAVHSASIGFDPMPCTLKRAKTSHIASSDMGGLLYKASLVDQYN